MSARSPRILSCVSASLVLAWLAGCSSEAASPSDSEATGGAPAPSGGTSGNGGTPNAGGGSSSGGQASGGQGPSSGGAAASGGMGTGGTLGGVGGAASGGAFGMTGGAASGGEPPGAGGGSTELGNATVWLAGDSTVANGNTPCPVGWGKIFDSLFDERITVVNSAVGGRSVRTWLYDVKDTMDGSGECALGETNGSLTIQQRWQDMLRDMKEGDFLLIQFGINDGDSTCPRHVGVDAFRQEYRMMAEAALERGTQPVFITPVSAIKCSGSTAVASRGFVEATLDEGAALGVPVIDLHARSIALYNELQFCPVSGGDVSASTGGPVGAFFCDDHTHFDTPGALEIGKLVTEGLRDAGVALAEYLL